MMMAEQVIDNAVATNATPEQPALQTPTDAAKSGSPKREYTQAELDDLFQERAKRAETATMNRVLKLLGVTSEAEITTLKTTIDKARELEKSAMTDTQRLEAERDQAKREKEEAIAQRDAERLERRNDRIASALTSAAGKIKANDTDDVLRYARDKHGEALNTLIDDSGAIDPKKIDTLLEKIKSEKPHYFTAPMHTPGSQSNANGRVAPQQQKADTSKFRI
jgi:hypothetical protein